MAGMADVSQRVAGDVAAATGTRRRTVMLAAPWRWLVAQERAPEPYTAGRAGRVCLLLLGVLTLVYAVVLSFYVVGLHQSFQTSAEDLGIMDQSLWTTLHGALLHQTVCDPIGDTNCLGDVSRFAIHFEPILVPLSLLYLVVPNASALLVVQVIVVASGAFPAYLLAARRLRNPAWGLAFGVLFLAHPSLLATAPNDFHPDKLAATAMMWALYCLAVRRYRALVALCVVLLLCKETFALDVAMIGLFVALVQGRRRLGLGLIGAAVLVLALALLLMRLNSPLGASPVAGRLSGLEHDPLGTLAALVTDPARRAYFVKLLAPVGFLPVLSPWVLALAAPTLLLNLVSTNPAMYSGMYQYNADIVPILLAAAIDGLVWALPLLARGVAAVRARLTGQARQGVARWLARLIQPPVVGVALMLVLALGGAGYARQAVQRVIPQGGWPTVTAHDRIGQELLARIPADASVSAQSELVPHLSERRHIYQFPDQASSADYVLLDVAGGVYSPYLSPEAYERGVQALLASCQVRVLAAEDGFLLLQHVADAAATPPCALTLPSSFYAFVYAEPPSAAPRVAVTYGGALQLVAYTLNTTHVDVSDGNALVVTTYWRVLTPITQPLTVVLTLTRPDGSRYVTTSFVEQPWLAAQSWPTGTTIRMQTWPQFLKTRDRGDLLLGVEVRAGAPTSSPPNSAAIPATLGATSPNDADALPRLASSGTSALLARVHVE